MNTDTKCRYADKYKGMRDPKCGCEVCSLKRQIWLLKQESKMVANSVAYINQIKAEAVREAVDIATRDITPAVSEMEVYIIRKVLEHAARLEGDK